MKLSNVTFTLHDEPMRELLWCDKLKRAKRNKPAKVNGVLVSETSLAQHHEISDAVEHVYYQPVQ